MPDISDFLPGKPFVDPPIPRFFIDGRIEKVPHSVIIRELAFRKGEAIALLRQSADAIEDEQFESALWRAVDAAGLLSFFVHREAIGMPPSPTGRGFFINKKKE